MEKFSLSELRKNSPNSELASWELSKLNSANSFAHLQSPPSHGRLESRPYLCRQNRKGEPVDHWHSDLQSKSLTLDILLKGRSILDIDRALEEYAFSSVDEVTPFLAAYGYNLEDPIDASEVLGHFQEALNFIRKTYLKPENPEGLEIEPPRKIVELQEIRELFLMASFSLPGQKKDPSGIELSYWACSLLRVMHTIAHLDKDLRSPYFPEIQKQILDRFYKFLHRDANDRLLLGDPNDSPVVLHSFTPKDKKSRNSILIKLLHKPENVAEELFDRIGVRFVTHTRVDALRLIHALHKRYIIVPANIKPSRSRNTLIDFERFSEILDAHKPLSNLDETKQNKIIQTLEESSFPGESSQETNKFSSDHYRSMQFTARHLIRIRNPLVDDIRDLKNISRDNEIEATLHKAIDKIDARYLNREIKFFYPFEIQIMDLTSFEENERGKSAHSEYKKAQVAASLRRVMSPFLEPYVR